MNVNVLVDLAQNSITTMLMVVAPVMIASFVIGILFSFLQAVFQIHEQTFSFVPKLLAIMVALIVYAPWMIQKMATFATLFLGQFHEYVGR